MLRKITDPGSTAILTNQIRNNRNLNNITKTDFRIVCKHMISIPWSTGRWGYRDIQTQITNIMYRDQVSLRGLEPPGSLAKLAETPECWSQQLSHKAKILDDFAHICIQIFQYSGVSACLVKKF